MNPTSLTNGPAPLHPHEQAQWLRLRALRVERARAALCDARAQEQACLRQVQKRRDAIAASRGRLDAIATAVVDRWASEMPRWADVVSRHREVLLDTLERDEYALIDDERKLESAQEVVQRCEADLARALNRESAAVTLVAEMRRGQARFDEIALEREIEDRAPPPQTQSTPAPRAQPLRNPSFTLPRVVHGPAVQR